MAYLELAQQVADDLKQRFQDLLSLAEKFSGKIEIEIGDAQRFSDASTAFRILPDIQINSGAKRAKVITGNSSMVA
jgi:hypothetical protein